MNLESLLLCFLSGGVSGVCVTVELVHMSVDSALDYALPPLEDPRARRSRIFGSVSA